MLSTSPACGWLLALRTMLWEEHAKEERVKEENCTGFYQDLDTVQTGHPPASCNLPG